MSGKFIDLHEVGHLVPSGCSLAVGGGPLRISPVALVREVIRAGASDLRVVAAPTGGLSIDLLIGAGRVRSVEFAQIVLNEYGSAPNFRRAAESGRLQCLEHS